MRGCRVEHIGIVVEDLDRSAALLAGLLGIEAGPVQDMPEAGMRAVSLQAENIRLELIQYTDAGEGVGRRVMGSATGYNHVSLEVAEMDRALDAWASRGARVMDGFPRAGTHGRVAFFEPASTGGLLLEICEPGG